MGCIISIAKEVDEFVRELCCQRRSYTLELSLFFFDASSFLLRTSARAASVPPPPALPRIRAASVRAHAHLRARAAPPLRLHARLRATASASAPCFCSSASDRRSPSAKGVAQGGFRNELDATPYLYMDRILDVMITTLTQPDTIMIGLYGSSYKSKENAIKKIKRRVEKDGQFDVVIRANLVKKNTWWNKSLDVRNIQEKLGNQLGLQLQEKTLEERVSCLSDKIKMKQNILIILDDLQGEINLTKIGIPFGNDHMGCRILLVSSNKEVLSNTMKIQSVFYMDGWF